MRDIRKIWSIRLAAGTLLGAILTTLLAWLLLSLEYPMDSLSQCPPPRSSFMARRHWP